jgi:SAM-dependent methyltransferase
MGESEPGSLPAVPYPRLERLLRTGERIWQEREDVRAEIGDIRSWAFWYWLMWHGATEYEEVRADIYPAPPANLTHRVVGEATEAAYRQSGLVNWRRMRACLAEAGFDFSRSPAKLLDFGCGSGRILQFFARYADHCTLVGADVDQEAVAWCRETFDFAEFAVLPKKPPSPFDAEHFDAVYAYSVFSHLPERLHRSWLEELHRIAAPGAALVLTTMGRKCLEELANGRTGGFPSAKVVAAGMDQCERDGFLFYPYRKLKWGEASNDAFFKSWDLEEYGSTFILPAYVKEHWLDLFDLVAIHEGPDNWQDFIVLKRR